MKTVYSSEYSTKYDILFKDAFDALVAAGVDMTEEELAVGTFTSLEEYFTRIGDLVLLHSNNVASSEDNQGYSKYSKFLMLPMDEIHGNNVFSIDPNSRSIQVPASYARNGVSVTGDELAETLLFEIDRFFDTTDLVTTDIYVQWTNPAGQEGASKVTLVDYNSKPGKLLFGWHLTSKVTTEGKEQLKFAIRFFKREGDKITYSMNTLPASVSIKQALYTNWNNDISIDDPSRELAAAIENGPASDGPEALVPNIYKDLNTLTYLDEGVTDTDPNAVDLQIRAVAMDSGIRSYTWNFKPYYIENNVVVEGPSVTTKKKEEYVKTSDSTPVATKKYYKDMGEGGFKAFDPETEAFVQDNLYEPCSNYHVEWSEGEHVTGIYSVEAHNRVGKRVSNKGSVVTLIPYPTAIVYNDDGNLQDNVWLTKQTIDGVDVLNATTLRVANTATPGDCALDYKWVYSDAYNGTMTEIMVPNAEGVDEPKSTTASLTTATPGWYQVTAYAHLNKETMYCVSDVCRVIGPIEAPSITPPADEELSVYDIETENGVAILKVTAEDMGGLLKSDKVTYTWYRNKPNENGIPVQASDKDVLSMTDGELRVKLLADDPQGVEFFYCIVTNHLADQTASSTSALFTIV